jgi:hypothetical protein
MIKATSKIRVRLLPLECIQIREFQLRYVDRLLHYIKLLQAYPDEYAGFLSVMPSDTHSGMYALLDGHTRFAASIMCGRTDALCVIIEEPLQGGQSDES